MKGLCLAVTIVLVAAALVACRSGAGTTEPTPGVTESAPKATPTSAPTAVPTPTLVPTPAVAPTPTIAPTPTAVPTPMATATASADQRTTVDQLRKNADEFEYAIGKRGGALTSATISEPITLNLAIANDASSSGVLGYLFEGLTRTSWLTDEVEPELAES